jgi:hypothetical protein
MAQLAEEGRDWSLFVLSADATFEEQVGRASSKRRECMRP